MLHNRIRIARNLRWLLLFAIAVTGAGEAAQVGGLNEALVPVADRSDKVRAEATREALRQVLIKLSGDRKAVASKPELLQDAADYVLQYQYREEPAAEPATGTPSLMLWVQFDDAPIRELLTGAGLPLWHGERPSLLVWALTDEAGVQSIAGSEEQGAVALALRRHAERRGLPLMLPLQDLDEQASISPDDIKQDDAARVTAASARYAPQAVSTAVLTQPEEGGWRGRFKLLRGEHGATWVAQGASLDEVVAQGVDRLADALAAPVRATAGDAETIEVQIEGITSSPQFVQVESYLRTVPGVATVALTRLEPTQVTFSVDVAGGVEGLTQAVTAGQTLQLVKGQNGPPRFRFLP